MKPIYQTVIDALVGNCLSAAVASILELPIEDVPLFVNKQHHWLYNLGVFAKQFDLYPIILEADQYPYPNDTYYIINGKSPRGEYGHSVVGFNGEIVHDPHPEGGGALETIERYVVFVAMLQNPTQYTEGITRKIGNNVLK